MNIKPEIVGMILPLALVACSGNQFIQPPGQNPGALNNRAQIERFCDNLLDPPDYVLEAETEFSQGAEGEQTESGVSGVIYVNCELEGGRQKYVRAGPNEWVAVDNDNSQGVVITTTPPSAEAE